MAAPIPKYDVVQKAGDIEVRRYPEMAAAETAANGDREKNDNAAFMALFRYISGANAGAAKIEMTAPVTQSDAKSGQKIEMTAPVTQSGSGDAWVMRFLLPPRFSAATAPAPTNPNVRIVTVPAQTVAVVRFSWFASQSALDKHEAELRAYMAKNNLAAAGPATYAFYDAPFTPPFLRRNEVMIPVGS